MGTNARDLTVNALCTRSEVNALQQLRYTVLMWERSSVLGTVRRYPMHLLSQVRAGIAPTGHGLLI